MHFLSMTLLMQMSGVYMNLKQKHLTMSDFINNINLPPNSSGKVEEVQLIFSGWRGLKIKCIDVTVTKFDNLGGTRFAELLKNYGSKTNVRKPKKITVLFDVI